MATEQMAQMFGQLQQLIQQLVNLQQMFQGLEIQRHQSQAQMESLTNLGAAQVAKTTYDARDSQTKTFFSFIHAPNVRDTGDQRQSVTARRRERIPC